MRLTKQIKLIINKTDLKIQGNKRLYWINK